MGAAKRRGTREQRIAQAQQPRPVAEQDARDLAEAELSKARQAQTPAEAERYVIGAQAHRRVAALMALMFMSAEGRR